MNSTVAGKCPKFPVGQETPFIKAVKIALVRTARFDPTEWKSDGNALTGMDDITTIFGALEKKAGTATKPTNADLKKLNRYAWNLAAEQQKKLRLWSDRVMEPKEATAAMSSSVGSGAAASSSDAPVKEKKRGAENDVNDLVVNMFKKHKA